MAEAGIKVITPIPASQQLVLECGGLGKIILTFEYRAHFAVVHFILSVQRQEHRPVSPEEVAQEIDRRPDIKFGSRKTGCVGGLGTLNQMWSQRLIKYQRDRSGKQVDVHHLVELTRTEGGVANLQQGVEEAVLRSLFRKVKCRNKLVGYSLADPRTTEYMPDARPAEVGPLRKLERIVDELFKGKVRALTAEGLGSPASEESIQRYYQGGPLTWGIVSAGALIERDLHSNLLDKLFEAGAEARIICISGEPGAGKSSLARQLAHDLVSQQDDPVLQVSDNSDPDIWYRFVSYCSQLPRRSYVLVDDILRYDAVLRALEALDPDLKLTILATSRTNEWPRDARLALPVERVNLERPSGEEKARLLAKLGKEREDVPGNVLTPQAGTPQFIVLVAEMATGTEWRKVIADAVSGLRRQDQSVYRAYEYLCHVCQYDNSMPLALLKRLDHEGRFHRLLEKPAAQGMIYADDTSPGNVHAGHAVIAATAAELYERDERSPDTVFREILEHVDASSSVEREFAARLARSSAGEARAGYVSGVLDTCSARIADFCARATVAELSTWRDVYRKLGLQERARWCEELMLSRELASRADCAALLSVRYCRPYCEKTVIAKCQEWLERDPDDVVTRFNCMCEAQEQPIEQVNRVLREARAWLAEHPENELIRNGCLRLAEAASDTEVHRLLTEMSDWLARHANERSFLYSYAELAVLRGTADDGIQAMRSMQAWIDKHPEDSFCRRAWLHWLLAAGSQEQVNQALRQTRAWLGDRSDRGEVRAKYLQLLEERGAEEHVASAIDDIKEELAEQPEDKRLRDIYIKLVEKRGTQEHVEEAIQALADWVGNSPQGESIPGSYLQFVQAKGTDEHVALVIKEARKRDPNDLYFELVLSRGTNRDVARAVEDGRARASRCPGEDPFSPGFLNLVEQRATKQQVAQVLQDLSARSGKLSENWQYRALLGKRGTARDAVPLLEELRKRTAVDSVTSSDWSDYVHLATGQSDQQEVSAALGRLRQWLELHPDDDVTRILYLNLLRNRGAKEQVRQAIDAMSGRLLKRADNETVRSAFLDLLASQGSKTQAREWILETSNWLAEHPQCDQVRRSYLALVEAKGTDEEVEKALKVTSNWLRARGAICDARKGVGFGEIAGS